MEKETLSKLDIIRSSSTEQSDIYGITLCFYYLFEILRVTGCNCCPQALIMWLSKGGSIQIDVLPFILSMRFPSLGFGTSEHQLFMASISQADAACLEQLHGS